MPKRSATVVALRPNVETIQSATRRFLAERDLAPRTQRVYGLTLDALAEGLGPDTRLSDVTREQLAEHLATRYSSAAPATFNRQVATFGSFFAWAGRQKLLTADPTDGLERRRAMAKTDLDPVSGRARLSYRRGAEQFVDASGGWTLHQLRHSSLTHLAEEGVDVSLLRAKSRHRSLRSLERYVRPSEASVARLTADHDRARRR